MMKNGMDEMGRVTYKFIKPASKCQNKLCGKMLKNKKKYTLTRVVETREGFWTIGKECRYCKADKSE